MPLIKSGVNGCLERFKRTVQEQCVKLYIDYLDEADDPVFNTGLRDYLIWYPSKEGPRNPTGVLAKPLQGATILIISAPRRVFDLNQSNMLWTLTAA